MASQQRNNQGKQISLAGIDFKALLKQVGMKNEDPQDDSHLNSSNKLAISSNAVDLTDSNVGEESGPVIVQNRESIQ